MKLQPTEPFSSVDTEKEDRRGTGPHDEFVIDTLTALSAFTMRQARNLSPPDLTEKPLKKNSRSTTVLRLACFGC